jgi:hypothetical protein
VCRSIFLHVHVSLSLLSKIFWQLKAFPKSKNPSFVPIRKQEGSRGSSVGLAKGYEMDGQGSISGRDKRSFFTPQRPDRLWGPHSLLPNGYRGSFPEGKVAVAWS